MRDRRYLNYIDRIEIENLIKSGIKDPMILARRLEVNKSTIYRELHRGGVPYKADTAQAQSK